MTEKNELLDKSSSDRFNKELVEYMSLILKEGKKEQSEVRKKIKRSYNIIVALSIIMFLIGVIFIIIPIHDYFFVSKGTIKLENIAIGGLGIADFVALFLLKPIETIHKLMGDMTQMTIAINSYQTQVSLRLLETDVTQRSTMGKAANDIKDAALASIESIQKYFESQNA